MMTASEERRVLGSVLAIALALLGLAMLFTLGGCATWQTTAAKTVLGVEAGGKAARAFLAEPCSPAKMKVEVEACIQAKDKECAPLRRCETAHKALHSLATAVLVAKLAIQAGEKKSAEAAVSAALQAVGPVMRAVEVWK
jgi:hypothetical protein